MRTISSDELDEKMKIFLDTKKIMIYEKHSGKWGWHNRDEQHSVVGFDSALEAVDDAISPYVEEDGDNTVKGFLEDERGA